MILRFLLPEFDSLAMLVELGGPDRLFVQLIYTLDLRFYTVFFVLKYYLIKDSLVHYSGLSQGVVMKMDSVAKSNVTTKVAEFLERSGLKDCHFTLAQLIEGVNRAGFRVIAEEFEPVGGLRGLLVDKGHIYVVFYPKGDPYLAVHTVGHEIGHMFLEHRRQSVDKATRANIYSDLAEQEADSFARSLMEHWQLAKLRERRDPSVPAHAQTFFGRMA